MMVVRCILIRKVRKGEEFKAPRYANAATTRDYITTYDIIPNTGNSSFVVAIYIYKYRLISVTDINPPYLLLPL